MMIRAIQSITASGMYWSSASSNAEFLKRYTNFADYVYARAPHSASPPETAHDKPSKPLTLALLNLKSAGVFSYLQGTNRSGKTKRGPSQGAAFRSPSQVAAEMPLMASMTHGDNGVVAIHDDTPKDNPIQTDGAGRSRIPGSDIGLREKRMAQLAPMPVAGSNAWGAAKAVIERNRAVHTIFMGTGNSYHDFSGLRLTKG